MKSYSPIIFRIALLFFSFGLFSCMETTYVHQNGTHYNDYKAVNHYRVHNAMRDKKIKSQSKAPNWKQYNTQSKYKRYNQ